MLLQKPPPPVPVGNYPRDLAPLSQEVRGTPVLCSTLGLHEGPPFPSTPHPAARMAWGPSPAPRAPPLPQPTLFLTGWTLGAHGASVPLWGESWGLVVVEQQASHKGTSAS